VTVTPVAEPSEALGVHLRFGDGSLVPLPVTRWLDEADPVELDLLGRAWPPVLDVGCGPGRLVLEAARRGWPVLGLEIAPSAVRLGRSRGASILERSIFDPIPAAGRWGTALLIDGTIGIDGHPDRLLRRLRSVLRPGGRVLAEVEEPGYQARSSVARIETEADCGTWFRWARVAADGVGDVAAAAGLSLDELWQEEGRWFAALTAP
jgi:SAM-dependent methyltransferase